MNKQILLDRIAKLNLTDFAADILIVANDFVLERELDVHQLKLHANLMKKKLSAKNISIKTSQSQELAAAAHGYKSWNEARNIILQGQNIT